MHAFIITLEHIMQNLNISHTDEIAVTVVAIMVILDIVSGIIKGASQHALSSAEMRQGLYHKTAYVLVLVFAMVLQASQNYLDISVLGGTVPWIVATATFIILTEAISFIENITEIDPELKTLPIFQLFQKVSPTDEAAKAVATLAEKAETAVADTTTATVPQTTPATVQNMVANTATTATNDIQDVLDSIASTVKADQS